MNRVNARSDKSTVNTISVTFISYYQIIMLRQDSHAVALLVV